MEYVLEFIQDIALNQIGEEDYREWVPYIGTLFLFIFCANWSGALIPWKLIALPSGELAAPTNDINTTVALSLSFRLFGNILADELVVSVLTLLVPLIVPLPVMVLGLFASSIQALIFSTLSAAYIGEAMEGH